MHDQRKYIVRGLLLFIVLFGCNYLLSSINLFAKSDNFYCGTVSNTYYNPDTSKEYKQGKVLFQNQCASCHSLYKDITGPALIGFTKRGPWAIKKNVWLYLQNPMKFYKDDKTGYMKALRKKFPVQPPIFKWSEKDVNDIIYYIEAEEKSRKSSSQ